jgi:pimeloyl-ACP methyl ester carboxylesterase
VVPQLSLPGVAMEMPHGLTANMTREAYTNSVLSTMDQAGFKRAILVGHSDGG